MKEQFRDKIPSGPMRTKYWIDKEKRIFKHWETDAELLTDQVVEIVEYYESIEIRLTNRQLYYQLVGKDIIPNYMEVYKRVCVFLTDLRYAGIVDWDAIEDKARVPKRPGQWDDVQSLIESATSQYRLPRWDDQEHYVEMYCEKEAGINVLNPVCKKYHIYFGFNKGYSSAAAMYELSKRISEQIEEGKYAIILYFGDHDPSGLDMIRDIKTRILEFLLKSDLVNRIDASKEFDYLVDKYERDEDCQVEEDEKWYFLSEKAYIKDRFKIIPVALTTAQVKKYNLPPNFAKITDPRAKWYIERFGKVSWELDAIDAMELRRIAEKAILEYVDIDKYNKWIKKEKKEGKILKDFGNTLT